MIIIDGGSKNYESDKLYLIRPRPFSLSLSLSLSFPLLLSLFFKVPLSYEKFKHSTSGAYYLLIVNERTFGHSSIANNSLYMS